MKKKLTIICLIAVCAIGINSAANAAIRNVAVIGQSSYLHETARVWIPGHWGPRHRVWYPGHWVVR